LKSSGELSGTDLEELDIHLKDCNACRQNSKDNFKIMDIALRAMPDMESSGEIMDNIKKQAQTTRRAPLIFRRHIIQWAAAAALVLIVLGNWSLHPASDNTKTEISDMYAVLAIVTDNAYIDDGVGQEQALPDMEELLLQIEDSTESYEITEEELWAPPAKSPQSSNMRVIQQKIYG
jgi:hypothetical protein